MLPIMKVLSRLYLLCVCLGFACLFMFSQGQKNTQTETSVKIHAAANTLEVDAVIMTQAERDMDTLKNKLEGHDLMYDLLYKNKDTDTELHAVYTELVDGYEQRKMNKTYVDELLPDDGWRERIFSIQVTDSESNGVSAASVYMWWAFAWYTDDTWVLELKKKIPTSYELIQFEVVKKWYSPWFYTHNGVHFAWIETSIKVILNNSIVNTVTTTTNDFVVATDSIEMVFDDPCTLIDSNGDCHEGEVEVAYTFIQPDKIRATSIPMQAIHNGKVVNLMSNGMAFTDFYTESGEPLIFDKKDWKICYNLSQLPSERVAARKDKATPWATNWYRWFNKATWYREQDTTAKITIDDKQFCVTTTHIY